MGKTGKTTMASEHFSARIWGARGTVSSTDHSNLKYGGNTACVEIRCGNEILIFDAGSGLRLLGNNMVDRDIKHTHLFFTHCHYDHISGLPFFAPFYDPQWHINIWSGHLAGPDKTKRMIIEYMRPPFFPVGPQVFSGNVTYHDFEPKDVLTPIENVRIETTSLNHHDGCVGYRIHFAGRSISYITDTTHIEGEVDQELVDFVRGTDLMIYDATYTDDEFPQFWNFGHSTWEQGIRICKAGGVKRYCMFHHRPSRQDSKLDEIGDAARALFRESYVGGEGLVIEV